MKSRKFTAEERLELERNPNILKVLSSSIEFTEAFKAQALEEHSRQAKTAQQIFAEAGVPDWLNVSNYARYAIKSWRKRSRQKDLPKRGRPKKQEKSLDEMNLDELKARIAYLELENDFLKKLKALEEGADINDLF